MPSYCLACRPEYSPTRSRGSGQALLHHISSVVQSVSLAEPSKQQRDTDRFTAKKVRVDLAWNFDFKSHPVPLAGGLGDDPARRSSFKM